MHSTTYDLTCVCGSHHAPGAYTFSALVPSGAVDIAFDRQGVLAAVIAMDGMSVPSLLSSIGATYALPSTDSMFTTDGSPSFRMTSSRSTDALLTGEQMRAHEDTRAQL